MHDVYIQIQEHICKRNGFKNVYNKKKVMVNLWEVHLVAYMDVQEMTNPGRDAQILER